MNEMVKSSIDARKTAVLNAYKITDENLLKKLDNLFERIYQFGETCADAMDFESKFATSELNQEYIALFTEIATCSEQIVYESTVNPNIKSDKEYILDEAKSELEYQIKDATLPARRIARQEAYETARDMPVIGEIMTAKQYVDFFGRFKKKKKDKDEEEDDKKEE